MPVQNVSAFATSVLVASSASFPFGFVVKEFTDDSNPIEVGPNVTQSYKMLLDGTLKAYKTAKPIDVALTVIPGGEDDTNLGIILSATKIYKKIIPRLAETVIMTVTYSNGGTVIFNNGALLSGPTGFTVTSAGRMAGATYRFAFGSATRLPELSVPRPPTFGLL